MAVENPPGEKRGGGTWIILLIIVFVILVIVFLVIGAKGFAQFLSAAFWAVIVGCFLMMFGFLMYYLFFKKKKVDLVAVQAKKMKISAHMCKPASINNVYLSGDRMHENVKIGKVLGFCKVLNYEGIEENIVTFKRLPFPFSLFEDEKVVRIDPQDMTAPVGDVYLFGLSLIKISEYFYLHKDMLNIKRVDYTILQEAKRGMTFLALSDMKEIVDKAVDLDSSHRKDLEQHRFIPVPGSNQEPPAQ